MYAVIRTGGKQYRVAPRQVVEIERLEGDAGSVLRFDEVLMLGGDAPQLGTPLVAGAIVTGTVLEQTRGPKIIIFKKRRRKNYRRRTGHRREMTVVRIASIELDGTPLVAKAVPVAVPKVAAAADSAPLPMLAVTAAVAATMVEPTGAAPAAAEPSAPAALAATADVADVESAASAAVAGDDGIDVVSAPALAERIVPIPAMPDVPAASPAPVSAPQPTLDDGMDGTGSATAEPAVTTEAPSPLAEPAVAAAEASTPPDAAPAAGDQPRSSFSSVAASAVMAGVSAAASMVLAGVAAGAGLLDSSTKADGAKSDDAKPDEIQTEGAAAEGATPDAAGPPDMPSVPDEEPA